jgi:hypothetical protein
MTFQAARLHLSGVTALLCKIILVSSALAATIISTAIAAVIIPATAAASSSSSGVIYSSSGVLICADVGTPAFFFVFFWSYFIKLLMIQIMR